MTLLTALISLFTALSSFQPLRGHEDTLRDDPAIQAIGHEDQEGTPGQMARAGFGGGHCPRG